MKNLRQLIIGGILVVGFTTMYIGSRVDNNSAIYTGLAVTGGATVTGTLLEEIAIRREESNKVQENYQKCKKKK